MVSNIIEEQWCCLSTDTKPIEGVKNGRCILEMDTRKVFIFDKENERWLPLQSE